MAASACTHSMPGFHLSSLSFDICTCGQGAAQVSDVLNLRVGVIWLMRRSALSQSRYTPQDCFTAGEYQINKVDKTVHKVHEGCAMYVLRNSPPAFPTRGFQALLSRRARDSNNYRVSQTTRWCKHTRRLCAVSQHGVTIFLSATSRQMLPIFNILSPLRLGSEFCIVRS